MKFITIIPPVTRAEPLLIFPGPFGYSSPPLHIPNQLEKFWASQENNLNLQLLIRNTDCNRVHSNVRPTVIASSLGFVDAEGTIRRCNLLHFLVVVLDTWKFSCH